MNAFEMKQFQALSIENLELKKKIEKLKKELIVLSAFKDATRKTFAAFAYADRRRAASMNRQYY